MRRLAQWFVKIDFLPDSTFMRRFMRRAIYEPARDPRGPTGWYHLGTSVTQEQAQKFSEWLEMPPKYPTTPRNE